MSFSYGSRLRAIPFVRFLSKDNKPYLNEVSKRQRNGKQQHRPEKDCLFRNTF